MSPNPSIERTWRRFAPLAPPLMSNVSPAAQAVLTPISFDDLEQALLWVSSPPEFDAAAFVSRTTGRIYSRGSDGPVQDDYPSDIEDGTAYIAVPHKSELYLGRNLVFRFIDEHARHLSAEVRDAFRRKGAYSRFKALLLRHRLLENWHQYENQETTHALEQWAEEQGFRVAHGNSNAATTPNPSSAAAYVERRRRMKTPVAQAKINPEIGTS